MKSFIQIGHRKVGLNYPPFIVAEMSGNHNKSLARAYKIIDAAVMAKADAIKIQTYRADTMTLDVKRKGFFISSSTSLWNKNYLYDLYKKAYTPWEWHKDIFSYCQRKKIMAFSTPFDPSAVDFLESLNVPCYKIASFENNDIPLIRRVARTGKPVIISTGMAPLREIEDAIRTVRKEGCKDYILLKCTSSYPALPKDSNLKTIPDMGCRFGCPAGLSDHTLGIGVALTAIGYGAALIEKHFTLSRKEGGVDSAFSLEPHELKQLVEESRRAWQARGAVFYGPTKSEKYSLRFRRSLYAVKDIKKGEIITPDNMRSIRPGFGLPPKYYEEILGMRARKNLRKGTPLKKNFLSS